MEPTDAVVIISLSLPVLVGLVEAWLQRRGVLGWIGSVLAAAAGGYGLMVLLVTLGGVPFSEGRAITLAEVVLLIYGGLVGGALLALWLVNRLRRTPARP